MQSAMLPAFHLTFPLDASMLPITMPPPTSIPVPSRLRYNVLLETLSEEEFASVRDKFTERNFRPDEVIIEDEGYGDEVHFLVDGRVRISKQVPGGEEQLLALLHPGDCFGELELIGGRPRSARVVAVDNCVTYVLHRTDFEQLLYRSRELAVRLLQVLSIRLRATNNRFVLESSRRSEQYRQELKKLEQLIEASKNLNSTLDLNKLLDILVDIALEIVDGDRGTVYILDEGSNELWTRVAKGLDGLSRVTIRLPLGKGIAGYVAATGDPINIPDAYLDPRFNPDYDRRTGYRTGSILCLPITTKSGKIIGVFQLLNKRNGVFTEDDARIMNAFSIHAAIALENARLYEQEREKIRIERDLLAAREVQMSLLPSQPPTVAGYEYAATALPAREVAGDLYDFIRLDPTHMAVSIGDVSGKGLPAALLMAHIQASVRDVAHEAENAGTCVTMLNQRLVATTAPEKFVTLVYGIFDTQNHTFRYCNAGHNPPYLVTAEGQMRMLEAGGTLLGIIDGMEYQEESVSLAAGEMLVLYTDGISEATNAQKELLGDERLAELCVELHGQPAGAVRDAILAAVARHQGAEPAADDMTVLVIRRLPA
jgi:phosphoserine phosphatase RsbU/P